MLIMRKVAMAAGAGYIKSQDFENFWPGPKGDQKETPSWASTSIELRDKLLKDFSTR